MANYGLLAGLGEGLQQFGGAVFKAKFLDKLKEEEEVRKEERARKREESVVSESKLDPVTGKISRFNKFGTKIREDQASQAEIDAANRDVEKAKQGIEAGALALAKARREEGYAAEDRELERRKAEAAIGLSEAQAGYYRDRGDESAAKAGTTAGGGGVEDAVDQLIKDNNQLFREYVGGTDEEGRQLMTASEFRDVARQAVKAAAERGVDTRSFFADHLRRYQSHPKSLYGQGRTKKVKRPLDDESL